jgi:ABC-type glycerol-3-phosphate transport system substrate-binding protein
MIISAMRLKLSAAACAASLLVSAGTAQAVELTFWSMWNEPEPQAAALRAIMDAYTAANPDTTFKVVWNGRGNQTKLRAALQAKTPVDFMDQDGDQLAGGLQKQGQLHALDDQIGADVAAAFLPGAYDLYAEDGKHYQVPYVYNTVNFWYNKDLMKEAGATVPKTWTDMLAMCATVKEKTGKYAVVVEGNDTAYTMLHFSHLLERQLGPDALVKIFEDKTGEAWKDPLVLDSAKKAVSLWGTCIAEDARGFQYPAGQQTIALGDSMSELVGSWLPTELADSAGLDFPWGAFNFPAVEGGKGKQTDLQVALLSMAVLKDAPHPKEAVDFLEFLMSEEAQKILVEQGNVGVTRKGVAWPSILQEAYDAALNATAVTNIYGGLSINYADFYTTTFSPEQNYMFLGQKTPEEFIEIMSAATKKYWAGK